MEMTNQTRYMLGMAIAGFGFGFLLLSATGYLLRSDQLLAGITIIGIRRRFWPR